MTPAELAELRRQKILARSGQRLQKIVTAAKPEDKNNESGTSGCEDAGAAVQTPEGPSRSEEASPPPQVHSPRHAPRETRNAASGKGVAEDLLDDLLDQAAGTSQASVPQSKSPKQGAKEKSIELSNVEDDDGSVPLTPLSSVASPPTVRRRPAAQRSGGLDDFVNETMATLNTVPSELQSAMNQFLGSPSGQDVNKMASEVAESVSGMERDLNNMLGGLGGGGGGLLGAMMSQQMNAMMGGAMGGAPGAAAPSATQRAGATGLSQGRASKPVGRLERVLADPFIAVRRVFVVVLAIILAFQLFDIAEFFNGSWVFAFAMMETAAFLVRFAVAPPKYTRHPLLESFNLGFLSAIPSFFADAQSIITDFSVFLFVSMMFYEGLTPLWIPRTMAESIATASGVDGVLVADVMGATEL